MAENFDIHCIRRLTYFLFVEYIIFEFDKHITCNIYVLFFYFGVVGFLVIFVNTTLSTNKYFILNILIPFEGIGTGKVCFSYWFILK